MLALFRVACTELALSCSSTNVLTLTDSSSIELEVSGGGTFVQELIGGVTIRLGSIDKGALQWSAYE